MPLMLCAAIGLVVLLFGGGLVWVRFLAPTLGDADQVAVAIVNDQRLVEPLGQVDVPRERLRLFSPSRSLRRAKVVETGLADGSHDRVLG